MKKYILFLLCLCFALNAQAQMSEEDQRLMEQSMAEEADMMLMMEEQFAKYEENVDEPAQHLDGAEGISNHLKTINAKTGTPKKGQQVVVVVIYIDEGGNPLNFQVADSSNTKLNAKAISALSGISRWKAARKNGMAVASKLEVPVLF